MEKRPPKHGKGTSPHLKRDSSAVRREELDRLAEEDALFEEYLEGRVPIPQPQSEDVAAEIASKRPSIDSAELEFMRAVAELSTLPETLIQRSDKPVVEDVEGARARPLRRAARGEIQVDAQIDLHGKTATQAERRLQAAIQANWLAGNRVVLVVTGRGLHSAGDAVLAKKVPRWLRAQQDYVAEVEVAPPHLGGQGALLVELRGRKDGKGSAPTRQ